MKGLCLFKIFSPTNLKNQEKFESYTQIRTSPRNHQYRNKKKGGLFPIISSSYPQRQLGGRRSALHIPRKPRKRAGVSCCFTQKLGSSIRLARLASQRETARLKSVFRARGLAYSAPYKSFFEQLGTRVSRASRHPRVKYKVGRLTFSSPSSLFFRVPSERIKFYVARGALEPRIFLLFFFGI